MLLEQGLNGALGLGLVVAVGVGVDVDGVLALALELAFLCLQIEDIEKPSEEGLV